MDAAFHEFRKAGVGGSDANILASGDAEKIEALRLEKRGEKDPPNFDEILPVQIGNATEELNAQWCARKKGFQIIDRGKQVISQKFEWHRCSLDGIAMTSPINSVWEAKHVGDRFTMEDIVQRYTAQCQHNMSVTGLHSCILSVFFGNQRWQAEAIPFDPFYMDDLLEIEERFWDAVINDKPYVAKKIDLPPPELVPVSMVGNNAWANAAGIWITNAEAAKNHEAAEEDLRKMVPENASRAFGHGVEISRQRDGKLRIKREK